jgi:hypothetical protein
MEYIKILFSGPLVLVLACAQQRKVTFLHDESVLLHTTTFLNPFLSTYPCLGRSRTSLASTQRKLDFYLKLRVIMHYNPCRIQWLLQFKQTLFIQFLKEVVQRSCL